MRGAGISSWHCSLCESAAQACHRARFRDAVPILLTCWLLAAGPIQPAGGIIPAAWQAVYSRNAWGSESETYHVGADGVVTVWPGYFDDARMELHCVQRVLPGPISGFLNGAPVQFHALLFNHYPGVAFDTCFLLFVDPSGLPVGLVPGEMFGLKDEIRCSEDLLRPNISLQSSGFGLERQTPRRQPYSLPPDCTSAAVDNAPVARWLQGTLREYIGWPGAGQQTLIEEHSLVKAQWYTSPSKPLAAATVERFCVREVQDLPRQEGGVYAQALRIAATARCHRFVRNLTDSAGPDIALEHISRFDGLGEQSL